MGCHFYERGKFLFVKEGGVYHFFEKKKNFFKYIFKKIYNTFCHTSQNLKTVT